MNIILISFDILFQGRGVTSTKRLSKGDFVVEYVGDLIDVKAAKERETKYAMDLSKGCYMYYFRANNRQYWWVNRWLLITSDIQLLFCTVFTGNYCTLYSNYRKRNTKIPNYKKQAFTISLFKW